MCSYLNSDRPVYAFRRSVPEHLRGYFLTSTGKPRTEWRYSLGTKDRSEAKTRCHLRAVETDDLIAEAQLLFNAGTPPKRPLTQIDKGREDQRLEAELLASEVGWREAAVEDHEWESRAAARQQLRDELKGPIRRLTPLQAAMRDLIPDEEFDTDDVKAARGKANEAEALLGAVEGLERVKQIWAGKPSFPTVSAMFEDYVREAKPAAATIKRWRGIVAEFVEFLAHDDATKVTVDDLRKWKLSLAGDRLGGKPALSQRSIRDVYFAAVKSTFSWGVDNGRVAENPVMGAKIRVKRKAITREKDFTMEEALLILRASKLVVSERLSPQRALARRWVPWICAYTGARVNEITQLRGSDVVNIEGVWAIRITPEAGGQKENRARTVPLHSHLVEQGFPAVAQAAGTAPIFYEPRLSRGGSDGNPQYKKTGERLAQWVRKIGVNDPAIQPNHAWRHTFKSLDRRYGLHPDAADAITGHAPSTEGRRYGERDLEFLSAQIEKLARFDA